MELKIKRNVVCSILLILTSHTSKIETLSPRFALSMKTLLTSTSRLSEKRNEWMRWFREIALTKL